MYKKLEAIDQFIITKANQWYMPMARVAFFVIFFYFGFLKLIGMSPASPLAEALTARTIGMQYFNTSFIMLALVECLIGTLFLVPKATRVVILLLFIHMAVVCSPLVLVPDKVWIHPFVPSLEGQYIIKNLALIAVAIGVAAQVTPLSSSRSKK